MLVLQQTQAVVSMIKMVLWIKYAEQHAGRGIKHKDFRPPAVIP